MTTLVLLRHGRTAWNAVARFQGQHDVPLDDDGRAQARHAAAALAGLTSAAGGPVRLVTSDLRRAHDTAVALGAALDVAVLADERLREVAAGRWQGLLQPEIRALDPVLYDAWRAGEDVPLGGAERPREAGARVARALAEHSGGTPDGLLLAVGHGAAFRAAVAHLLGLDGLRTGLVPLGNTACALLERMPARDGSQPGSEPGSKPGSEPGSEPGTDHGTTAARWRLRAWNVPPEAVPAVLSPAAAPPVTVV